MREAILQLPKFNTQTDAKAHHQEWASYWRSRSQDLCDDCAGLAWFHDWQNDREAAFNHWQALASQARGELRTRDHQRVLEWIELTGIETDRNLDEFEARMLRAFAGELAQDALGHPRGQLIRAVAACQRALMVFDRDREAQDWAMTQNNLGNALWNLGTRSEGEASRRYLEEAVAACRAALEVYTREALPQGWAMTQNTLGLALEDLGGRSEGEAGRRYLEEAVAAYRAALEVYTREALPQGWAMTQNTLGTTLWDLGRRSEGEPGRWHLEEAVAAYRAALEVRTREALPQGWATTQNNLGNLLVTLSSTVSTDDVVTLLAEAARGFRNVLELHPDDLGTLSKALVIWHDTLYDFTAAKECGEFWHARHQGEAWSTALVARVRCSMGSYREALAALDWSCTQTASTNLHRTITEIVAAFGTDESTRMEKALKCLPDRLDEVGEDLIGASFLLPGLQHAVDISNVFREQKAWLVSLLNALAVADPEDCRRQVIAAVRSYSEHHGGTG